MLPSDYWADQTRLDNPNQLWRDFERVHEQSLVRVQMDYHLSCRYYDRAYQGFSRNSLVSMDELKRLLGELFQAKAPFYENVIARIVSVIAAKFSRQRTMPQILTEMGDWGLQRRSEKYTRFLRGIVHSRQAHSVQRSSDIFDINNGTGPIYVGSDDSGGIDLQAVPPWELFVDTLDARRMKPSVIYWHQLWPRRNLARKYPKHRKAINGEQGASIQTAFNAGLEANSDVVEVVSAWSLPSEPGSDDGKVVSSTRGIILDQGIWDRPRLPFAFARYSLPPDGMWGIGVVQQLLGLQDELNRTYEFRRESLKRLSSPFILIAKGAKVVKSHINNIIGHVLEWDPGSSNGVPPQIVTPQVIAPEQFQHSDRVRSSMFQNSGISELASASMKPAGVNSGEALRAYSDMMDDAFHDAMLRRDQQVLDMSEIILDEIESLADDNGSYKSRYVGPFGFEEIRYSEVATDRDAIVMRVQSTSALATTFSGRLQDVKDMDAAGVPLTSQEKEDLLNVPDLSESRSRRYSMPYLIRHLCEIEMLDKGNYRAPEPRWDIDLCLDIVSETILKADLGNAPKSRIELLRRFERECMAMQLAEQMEAQQQQPPQQTMPEETPSPIAVGDMSAGAIAQ